MIHLSKICLNVCLVATILITVNCKKSSSQADQAPVESMVQEDQEKPAGLVEVKAVGLTLQAPNEILSGWTTFRFINASEMVHLAYLYKVPDSIELADHKEVAAVFQNFMDTYNERPLSEPEAGMELPAFFAEVVPTGGPGLVSPGGIGETTIFMEPGTYFIECYVKTDGIFHSYNSSPTQTAMVHLFKVSSEDNQVAAPMPTINISVSTETGMSIAGEIGPGSHIFGVTFLDQKVYENFVGHDAHLIRLTEDSNLDEIISWMDWRKPTGLQTPAPAGIFLGGTNELPEERTAYFKVDLEPGDYVLISEVPEADQQGLLLQFEVAEAL